MQSVTVIIYKFKLILLNNYCVKITVLTIITLIDIFTDDASHTHYI